MNRPHQLQKRLMFAIDAQLRRGTGADVVILSREGLVQLLAEGRIVPGW
jgi:hypothetical protein